MAINPIDPLPVNGQPQANPQVPASAADAQAAVDLIREKLNRIYGEEPDVAQEMTEAELAPRRTKHQSFMYSLSSSGKDLVAIQTEWHNYYQSLPDDEKHQVWQEFYESQPLLSGQASPDPVPAPDPQVLSQHKHQATSGARSKAKASKKIRDVRSTTEVKAAIRNKVSAGGKLEAKHHLQSLMFGLGMGLIVLIVFLFSFFNEVIIAPFIQPSRVTADTPLIVNSDSVATTSNPEVIVPKINVEIPVNYSETTTNESAIENDLMDGVVHYPTTSVPGQNGNAAFFGHSSNNIFNKGKYKFAFVLLHTLVPGDTFYLSYNSKVYVYKVISRQIVEPSDVSVLNPVAGQTATATLITCDPPGTSLHRLVVVGQQISPDPSGNTTGATAVANASTPPGSLPNDGPTLWNRFITTVAGKACVAIVIAGGLLIGFRKLRKPLISSA